MSSRAAAICVAILVLMGCDTKEVVNSVKHQSAWQREAGESPQEMARLAKQCDKNTDDLLKKLADNDTKELNETMRGKLVKLEGEVTEQTEAAWMIRTKDGWMVIASINDLTPHGDVAKAKIETCDAQGLVHMVDPEHRKIMLVDVELTPKLKG